MKIARLVEEAQESRLPIVARAVVERVQEVAEEERSDAAGLTDEELSSQLLNLQPRKMLETIVATSRDEPLPPILTIALPHHSIPSTLSLLWSTFRINADFSPQSTDLELALSFVNYLTTPSSSPTPTTHLPVALRVLQSLLNTSISPSFLASSPKFEPPLPQTASVQFVILRTATAIAIETSSFAVASELIRSICDLRDALNLSTKNDCRHDRDLLNQLIHYLLSDLTAEVNSTYRPNSLSRPTEVIDLTHTLLLDLVPKLADPSPWETYEMLDKFVREAAPRERWDLMASLWRRFRPLPSVHGSASYGNGWLISGSRRLKLLKYLVGRGPDAAYCDDSRMSSSDTSISPFVIKIKASAEAHEFARETLHHLRKDQSLLPPDSPTRAEWLRILCLESRLRHLLHSFYSLFHSASTFQNPFILPSRTLLKFVRHTCTLTSGRNAVRDYIHSRTDISGNLNLDPYDYTTLAQAYTILNDHESFDQVYLKMKTEKLIPSQKDLEVLLESVCIRDGVARACRWIKRWWRTCGVIIGPEIFERCFTGPLLSSGARDGAEGLRRDLAVVLKAAQRVMRNSQDRERIENWKNELVHQVTTVHPHRNMNVTERGGRTEDWRSIPRAIQGGHHHVVIGEYQKAIKRGIQSPTLFALVLHFLLRLYKSSPTQKLLVRRKLEVFVTHAVLTEPSLVQTDKTWDDVLRFMNIAREVSSVEILVQRLGGVGLKARKESLVGMRGWLRAEVGTEKAENIMNQLDVE